MMANQSVSNMLQSAYDLVESAQHERALNLYNSVLALDKKNQDALFGQALCYARLGKYKLALRSYDELEKLNKVDPCLFYNKARAFACLNQEHDAEHYRLRATEVLATDAEGFRCQGNAYDELGDTSKALNAYDESLVLDSQKSMTYLDKAVVLRRIGKPQKALVNVSKAITIQPDFAEAYIEKAECLTATGELELAIAAYDKALALSPNLIQALMDKGWLLETQGRLQAALDAYDQAILLAEANKDMTQLATLLYNKANIYYEMDRFDDALEAYQLALNEGGEDPDILTNMGQTYEALDLIENAVDCYKRAMKLEPADDIAKKIQELAN